MVLNKKSRFLSGVLIAALLITAVPVYVYGETGELLSSNDHDASSITGWIGRSIDTESNFDFISIFPNADWYQYNNLNLVAEPSPKDINDNDEKNEIIEYSAAYDSKTTDVGKIYKDYILSTPGYYNLNASVQVFPYMNADKGAIRIELYDNTEGSGVPVGSSYEVSKSLAGINTGNAAWETVTAPVLYVKSKVKMIRIILEASVIYPDDASDFVDFDGLSVILTQAAAPPIISNLNSDLVTYTEDDMPVPLDQNQNVTVKVDDSFARTYEGGLVTASITSNGVVTEDVLELDQTGGITLSGDNVSYNGTPIGTYSAGGTGMNISVSLNANANDTSVAALIKSIVYKNINTANPNINPRTVMVSVSDNCHASEPVYTTVQVQRVNDAPVRRSGIGAISSDSVPVRTPYQLDLSTIFEDPDTDPLNYKVKVNDESAESTAASYVYTPQTAGTYTLVFTANDSTVDSTDTYTVTLTALNTAPVRKSSIPATESKDMTAETSYSLDLNTIFEDADGDPLTYNVKVNEEAEQSADSIYNYTPPAAGTYSLVFKAYDGIDDSADTYTVTLNVKAPNIPPVRKAGVNDTQEETVPVKKAYEVKLDTIFEDANDDLLTYKVKIGGGAETDAETDFSYIPASEGTFTLVFRAYDGSAYSTDTYNVIITAVNNPPVRKSVVEESVSEHLTVGTSYVLDLSEIFEDENQDPLTYKVKVNDNTEETISKDYTFTPAAAGSYTLVFKANDGSEDSTDTYTVTMNVKLPNHAPVIRSEITESPPMTVPAKSVYCTNLAYVFVDPDNDPMTFTVKIDDNPEVPVDHNFTYTVYSPGTHTLVFKASDGMLESTETYKATIIVTKIPLNSVQPPDAVTAITNGSAKTAAALGLPETVSLVSPQGTDDADITWNVAACSYDPDLKTEQTFDVEGTISLPDYISNPYDISLDVTISVTVKAELLGDKVLVRISPVTPITGIPNGSAKTVSSLQLPDNVILETDQGTVSTGVTWNVAACSYDPDQKTAQTFEVEGTVNLPAKVVNPDGVSLSVTAKVTVEAESLTDKTLERIYSISPVKGITNGTAKTVTALGIPAKVLLGTDDGNVQADVVWDLDSSSYDPVLSEEQIFTVDGTVELPDNVINPAGIPLEVTVEVTVLEEEAEQEYYTLRIRVTKRPDKVSYTLGEDLDTQGLEVTEYQKASPSNAVRKIALSEDQYDLEYNLARTGTRHVKVIYYGTDRNGNEKEFKDEFTVRVKEQPRDNNSDDDDDDREIVEPGWKSTGGDEDHYYPGTWKQDDTGWRLSGKDGSRVANRWVYTDWSGSKDWYFFDEKGYLVTGWFEYKGNVYYLNPVSDGKKGSMYTGWNMIDGKWYYFSEAADETKGSVLRNTVTPDGHRVGPDGARIS